MPIDLSARLHTFLHSFGQGDDAREAQERTQALERLLDQKGLLAEDGRVDLAVTLSMRVLAEYDLPPDHAQFTTSC